MSSARRCRAPATTRGANGPSRATHARTGAWPSSFAMCTRAAAGPKAARALAEFVARDEHIGRNRIIRLMQQEGLEARVRRRYRSTTMSEHDQPVAPNLL